MEKLSPEKQQLVLDNLNLVHFIVHKQFGENLSQREELFQEGCVGLIKAVNGFDPSRGFAFSTYAGSMIRGTILHALREAHLLSVPRSVLDHIVQYRDFVLNNPEAREDEVIAALGINAYIYHGLVGAMNIASLDAQTSEDGLYLHETVASPLNGMNDSVFYMAIEQAANDVLLGVSPKHRDIIEEYLYSALYGEERIDQRALGKKYYFSQAQVSRLISKYIPEILARVVSEA